MHSSYFLEQSLFDARMCMMKQELYVSIFLIGSYRYVMMLPITGWRVNRFVFHSMRVSDHISSVFMYGDGQTFIPNRSVSAYSPLSVILIIRSWGSREYCRHQQSIRWEKWPTNIRFDSNIPTDPVEFFCQSQSDGSRKLLAHPPPFPVSALFFFVMDPCMILPTCARTCTCAWNRAFYVTSRRRMHLA